MRLTGLWWWIDRWRKSTAYTDMTLEEQGAYRNLLDEASLRGGPIPNDDRVLAKASGDARRWAKVRPAVLAHFRLTPDGWRNETLDSVLEQSMRRAMNQANYRNRKGHNTTNNGHDNDVGHSANNNPDNKPASPDPDPGRSERAPTARAADLTSVRTQQQPRRDAPGGRAHRRAASAPVDAPPDHPSLKNLSAKERALLRKHGLA